MPGHPPEFTMEFEPTTIEHLGLKLYVSLPPVIGELVSNAWDADAKKVEVTFPETTLDWKSEVIVRDYGHGMDAKEIQDAYLHIGLNRREATGKDTSVGGRRLMGRKGLGKLATFGVAVGMEVRSIKKGVATCLKLNYDDMRATPKAEKYKPVFVPGRSGATLDANGTEVRITKLHRTRAIETSWVKQELARRFTVIGDEFKVLVNGQPILPEDRRLRDGCKKCWEAAELPSRGVVDTPTDRTVTGWIGLVPRSSQAERGVDIFARGKAVELDTMFGLRTTHAQFARAYVVGEIHAEFLDAEEDNISTGRNAAQWESEAGQRLQEWGQKTLTWVFEQWLALQRKEKEEKIVRVAGFDKWLATRNGREQKIAKKLLKAIVQDEHIEPEAAGPLLEVIKANVEFQAFQELVDEIEDKGSGVQMLLKLFQDWRVIEAREHLKLSDGRLEIMESLSELMEKNALEVQEMQPLFEQNGWLVEPSWGEVTGQTTYTKALRENCTEPKGLDEKDRRIDILGYAEGGALYVVEIKRPGKTLSREDLEQTERYVDWARTNLLGTGEASPKYVRGLLIVGQLSKSGEVEKKMQRLAGDDIRVETYKDLLQRARNIFGQVERRLKARAPEYSREARKARRAKK